MNKEVRFEIRTGRIGGVSQEPWKRRRVSVLCHCSWSWGWVAHTDWEMLRGSLHKMPISFSVWTIYFKETCSYSFLMWCFSFSTGSFSYLTFSGFSIVSQSQWKSHSNMFRIFSFYHLLNVWFVSLTFLLLLMWLPSFPLSEMPSSLSLLLKPKQISIFHLLCCTFQSLASSENALKICQLLLNFPVFLQYPSFSVQRIDLSF